ncbi:MAG TPA: hypothetical protein VIE67_13255 [Rudaea sp.]|jgi:hypothetical protein|uniref:hypothetical protein n=1 Tax=Rudaea sp. TaxID=2136325 RepID=UPI002F937671
MCEQQSCSRGGSGEIENAVITYLGSRPRAADTLEGIVSWWLPLQRYEIARVRIETVLAHLVDAGVLRRDRLPDGADLYALDDKVERTPHPH